MYSNSDQGREDRDIAKPNGSRRSSADGFAVRMEQTEKFLLPFFNFTIPNKFEIYKKHNFYSYGNASKNIFEISIHVDNETEITKLIPFLQSSPDKLTFNIIGNIKSVTNSSELLSFLINILLSKI